MSAVLAAHGIHRVIAVDDLVRQEQVGVLDGMQRIVQHAHGEHLHGGKVEYLLLW